MGKLWKLLSSLCHKAKSYLENTSIHGLRYVIDEESHWFERIFWLLVCCLSFVGTYFLFVATWSTYVNNPISFVTETTYLDWNTTFPAVSVCEAPSPEKAAAFAEMIYGEDRNPNYDTYIGEVVYYSVCTSCTLLCSKILDCPKDVTSLVEKFRAPCDGLLTDCSWNGEPFDCCSFFEPLETQYGICYTINSMQTPRYVKGSKRSRKLDLVSNRNSGPGKLEFHIQENADVSIHAPEDVPFTYRPLGESWLLHWGKKLVATFQVSEIVNDPMLQEVSVEQRQCRFPEENPHTIYPRYSYSTCMVDCIAKEQIKLCGCLHHFMPGQAVDKKLMCKLEGLRCLYEHKEHLGKVRVSTDRDGTGVTCDCLSSCTEPEYRILSQLVGRNPKDPDDPSFATEATISMVALPTQRFIRNVVRTKLDLVVSMGGTAGLFLGASLLSIVELIYYCCVRGKTIQQQENKVAIKRDKPTEKATKTNKTQKESWSHSQYSHSHPGRGPGYYRRDYLSQLLPT